MTTNALATWSPEQLRAGIEQLTELVANSTNPVAPQVFDMIDDLNSALATRINDLHAEHRALYIELDTLSRRGLDYTDAYAAAGVRLAQVENELAAVAR